MMLDNGITPHVKTKKMTGLIPGDYGLVRGRGGGGGEGQGKNPEKPNIHVPGINIQ